MSLAVLFEVAALVRSSGAPAEAAHVCGLCAAMFVLAYLDVFHKDLFGTTHVTGTWLHVALRQVAFDIALRLCGGAAGGAAAYYVRAYVCPLAHALVSYAAGRWLLRLHERSGPLKLAECAVGLAASYAVVAATLKL